MSNISIWATQIINFKDFFKRLRHDNRGASALLIGFSLIPIIGVFGFATDLTRAYIVKSRLGDALDAAALAGGRSLFEKDVHEKIIQKYFKANIKDKLMGATVSAIVELDKDEKVLVSGHIHEADESTLRVKATAEVPTLLMSIFTDTPITVESYTEVVREDVQLDIILAIDMSGSMGYPLGGSGSTGPLKVKIARDAAKNLVNILFGSNAVNPLLKIGLVPWSGSVNITDNGTKYGFAANGTTVLNDNSLLTVTTLTDGEATNPYLEANYTYDGRYYKYTRVWNNEGHKKYAHRGFEQKFSGGTPEPVNVLQNYRAKFSDVFYAHNAPSVPLLAEPLKGWKGCVYARYAKENAWAFSGSDEKADDAIAESNAADMEKGSIRKNGKHWVGWYPMNDEETEIQGKHCKLNLLRNPEIHSNKIKFNPKNLKEYWPNKPTKGYRIKHDNGEDCVPCLNQGITKMQHKKSTIISAIDGLTHTVGATNIPQGLVWSWRAITSGAPFNQASVPVANRKVNSVIILLTDGKNEARVGDAYNSAVDKNRDQRSKDVAQRIKDDNVIIYTIQFANNSGVLQTLLEEIATSQKHYFSAPDKATLQKVFTKIANDLSALRISR